MSLCSPLLCVCGDIKFFHCLAQIIGSRLRTLISDLFVLYTIYVTTIDSLTHMHTDKRRLPSGHFDETDKKESEVLCGGHFVDAEAGGCIGALQGIHWLTKRLPVLQDILVSLFKKWRCFESGRRTRRRRKGERLLVKPRSKVEEGWVVWCGLIAETDKDDRFGKSAYKVRREVADAVGRSSPSVTRLPINIISEQHIKFGTSNAIYHKKSNFENKFDKFDTIDRFYQILLL